MILMIEIAQFHVVFNGRHTRKQSAMSVQSLDQIVILALKFSDTFEATKRIFFNLIKTTDSQSIMSCSWPLGVLGME